MFYKLKVKDHVRLPPTLFGEELETGIIKQVKHQFDGYISKETGLVIDVMNVHEIGEGKIIMGDGAVYYESEFTLLVYRPEIHEIVAGEIKEIADFGVFLNLGPIDGMIHVSQTMNDFVSMSKDRNLQGKDTKRSLRITDRCKAKFIAISYKDLSNPKFGLTMRQVGLGKQEWIDEDFKNEKKK